MLTEPIAIFTETWRFSGGWASSTVQTISEDSIRVQCPTPVSVSRGHRLLQSIVWGTRGWIVYRLWRRAGNLMESLRFRLAVGGKLCKRS